MGVLNGEILQPYVHCLPEKMRQLGEQYGLCIFNFGRDVCSPAGEFYQQRARYFDFFSLSHLIDGDGRLWMPGSREQKLTPGQCIIMTPRQVNRYGGAEDVFCEDHVCFTGPIADRMLDCGIIQSGVFAFGSIRRLLPIMDVVSCPSLDCQFEANLMLQRLLVELYRENRNSVSGHRSLIEKLLVELKKNVCHPWTVSEMSEFCRLSDDQLRRLFLQHTGMGPKQYIDRLRMRIAATMLTERPRTVKEVAEELGYKDRFHFSRRFKAIHGLSPQSYRDRFGGFGSTSRNVLAAPLGRTPALVETEPATATQR